MPLLLLAALIGMSVCWRSKQQFFLPVACWIGFSVLAWGSLFRWLSGEGLLPVVLLAGLGVHGLSQRLSHAAPGSRRPVLVSALIVGLMSVSPTLTQRETLPPTNTVGGGLGWQVAWADSGPFHLLGSSWVRQKALDASLAVRQTERLVRVVALKSRPREVLWSNAPYALGFIAALAQRPMSSAMFSEVGPARPFDPVEAAQMLVWFKIEPLPGGVPHARLLQLPVTKLFEDEVAIVYRRQDSRPLAGQPRAVMPGWLAAGLALGLVGFVAWDVRSAGHRPPTPV